MWLPCPLSTFPAWTSYSIRWFASNWWQSLFCCCTASMAQATDGTETAAIDGFVSSWPENISISLCLRAPGYGLTLWCALGLLVGGAIQVPQLQLQFTGWSSPVLINHLSELYVTELSKCAVKNIKRRQQALHQALSFHLFQAGSKISSVCFPLSSTAQGVLH